MTGTPSRCALLIPCHNGRPYLDRLFASAAAQTRPFDEIWLFDDSSTDGSAELAAELGARVIRSEACVGPSVGRNRLVRACSCEWLHFHDVDDIMEPNYLSEVLAATDAGGAEKPELVICDMLWIRESDGGVDNRWVYSDEELRRDPVAYMIQHTIGGINGLYRREAFLAAGGFDETLRFWEDMDLGIRLFQNGARACVVSKALVTAYRRSSSYSNSNLAEVWRAKVAIMRKLLPQASIRLRQTIADEAERIADRQMGLGVGGDIQASLVLAVAAGANPPSTSSRALRVLKWLLPMRFCFILQHHLRRILRTS